MTEAVVRRYTESAEESDVDDGERVDACGAAAAAEVRAEGAGPRPELWDTDCVMGIDEAGRGPVLGPMVYCGFVCAAGAEAALRAEGFDDSKALTPAARARLLAGAERAGRCAWFVRVLSARRLSRDMLRLARVNLNALSHAAAAALVRAALAAGLRVRRLCVDTVGDAAKYRARLAAAFPQIPDIVVAPRADATFPCVGAASVVAKCVRDDITAHWRFRERPGPSPPPPRALVAAAARARRTHALAATLSAAPPPAMRVHTTDAGEEDADAGGPLECDHAFGCGYPSDAATRRWLEQHADRVFGYPSLIRFSWKTCTTFLARHACTVRWGGEDDDENDADAAVPPERVYDPLRGHPCVPRATFFAQAGLQVTTTL